MLLVKLSLLFMVETEEMVSYSHVIWQQESARVVQVELKEAIYGTDLEMDRDYD